MDIGRNELGNEGISHVAEALKQNKQLKELWIGGGVMTDKGAASLASALTVNNSLKMLHMGGAKGALTEDGFSAIAHSLANKSKFMKLAIPDIFGSATAGRLSEEVIERGREMDFLPSKLKVSIQYVVSMCHINNFHSHYFCILNELWLIPIMF